MKNNILRKLTGIATVSLCASATQAAFMEIDDVVQVYLLGSIQGGYQSNIFYSENNETDDTFLIVTPGVEVNVGRNSRARLNVTFQERIVRFTEISGFNREAANIAAVGSYEMGRVILSANAGFRQRFQNTVSTAGLGTLNEREETTAGLESQIQATRKVKVEAGFDYNDQTFVGASSNLNDRSSYAFPVDVLYQVTQKTFVGLGYRARFTDVESGAAASDYTDHFFSLALRGDIGFGAAPKLTGKINLGYQFREADGNGGDSDRFSVKSDIKWEATKKTSLTLGYDRDFRTGSQGESISSDDISLQIRHRLTELFSSKATFGYRFSEYEASGREDGTSRAQLAVTYKPNEYISFEPWYKFLWNDNSGPGTSLTDHQIGVLASVRY